MTGATALTAGWSHGGRSGQYQEIADLQRALDVAGTRAARSALAGDDPLQVGGHGGGLVRGAGDRSCAWAVAALCSSTAAAIVLCASTTPRMMSWTLPSAVPAVSTSCRTASTTVRIRWVAWAVSSARSLTSPATTAKPLPASPARADSMVALSASRLVWSAIAEMLPAIWSISAMVPASRSTVSAPVRDCALASWAVVLAPLAAAAISAIAERSPSITSVAVATLPSSRRPASTRPEMRSPSRTARSSPLLGLPGGLVGGPRPLLGELELRTRLRDLLLLGHPLLRAPIAVQSLGELPAVGEERRLDEHEDGVQRDEGQRVVVRVRGEDRLGDPDARRRVMDGDEADGHQERRPHLVQRDQRQQRVEPDVQVGEAAAHVHQDVGTDHQAQAHRARTGHLAAQDDAEHHQDGDHGELAPQQPPAHTADQADERQRGHVGDEHGRGHAVAGGEAAGVELGTPGDGRPEAAPAVVGMRGTQLSGVTTPLRLPVGRC
jgi:hypothetical protein